MGDPRRGGWVWGEGSETPWVGGEGRGAQGTSRRRAEALSSRGPTRPRQDGPSPGAPAAPEHPLVEAEVALGVPGLRRGAGAARGPAPLPRGRVLASPRDDVTPRGAGTARRSSNGRAGALSLWRRRRACAVAAGTASRAARREGALSPWQRGLHARPEARVGLEGQRGAKKGGGGTESPQGSPGEVGERLGEG